MQMARSSKLFHLGAPFLRSTTCRIVTLGDNHVSPDVRSEIQRKIRIRKEVGFQSPGWESIHRGDFFQSVLENQSLAFLDFSRPSCNFDRVFRSPVSLSPSLFASLSPVPFAELHRRFSSFSSFDSSRLHVRFPECEGGFRA